MGKQTTLFTEGLDILKARKVQFCEKFIPFFFASYGAHCINLANRQHTRPIYFEHGGIPDLRLHLIFCAPPGFSKSFFMKQVFGDAIGLLYTRNVPTTFEGSVTEAAWVGSYSRDGDNEKRIGLAEEYSTGVVAVEEFQAITQMMLQKHSTTFEAQLNASLFGGDVSKRIISGPPIKYHTDATLIGGTQIMKFDLSAGLLRRFNYIYWVPTFQEMEELNKGWQDGTNVPPDMDRLIKYRNAVADWQERLKEIKHISFSDRMYRKFGDAPHFERIIYRKLALGYCLFASPGIGVDFVVDLDSQLEHMLEEAITWRHQVLADPEGSQVISVVQDYSLKFGSGPTRRELQIELLKFSMAAEMSYMLIGRLVGSGQLFFKDGRLWVNK